MSYDLFLYKFTGPLADFAQSLRKDEFEPPTIGDPRDVREAVRRALPATEWTDDVWAHFDGPGYRIAFFIGTKSPVRSIMLNLYGDSEFLRDVASLCQCEGWQALDPQTGKFLDLTAPSTEGLTLFRQFMGRVADALDDTHPDSRT